MRKTAEHIAVDVLIKIAEEEHPGMRAARGAGGMVGGTVGGVAGGVAGGFGVSNLLEALSSKAPAIHGGGPMNALGKAGLIAALAGGALGAGAGSSLGSGDLFGGEEGDRSNLSRLGGGALGGALGGATGSGIQRGLEKATTDYVRIPTSQRMHPGASPGRLKRILKPWAQKNPRLFVALEAAGILAPLLGAGAGAAAGSGAFSPK